MNTKVLYRVAMIFLISVLAGQIAFVFWIAPYLFSATTLQAKQVLTLLNNASVLTYGTVVRVDTTRNMIVIEAINPFENDTQSQFEYVVEPAAYIARQELQVGPDGQYASLSPELISPLSAIQPGDHVAILGVRNADNLLSTGYILFGNPL